VSTVAWRAPADVFAHLAGDWTLDRRADGRPLMAGQARFRGNPDGSLTYHEQGQAVLGGASFAAERTYLYRQLPAGFAVFFAEHPPRLFHEIVLTGSGNALVGDARHLCNADLYLSRYEFYTDGTFSMRHDVSGPRKDYVLETTYCRMG
jgi:hypothetical protein